MFKSFEGVSIGNQSSFGPHDLCVHIICTTTYNVLGYEHVLNQFQVKSMALYDKSLQKWKQFNAYGFNLQNICVHWLSPAVLYTIRFLYTSHYNRQHLHFHRSNQIPKQSESQHMAPKRDPKELEESTQHPHRRPCM